MRGTLTNGYEWLFIVVSVNPDGEEASYMISTRSYSAAPPRHRWRHGRQWGPGRHDSW